MKYIVSMFIIVFFIAQGFGQEKTTVTIPLSDPGQIAKLSVNIKNGNISVIGTERKDMLVTYIITKKSDEDEHEDQSGARSGLKKLSTNNYDFEIGEENNIVTIESKTWFANVELEVEVPNNSNLDLENYMGGIITVKKVTGELALESYTGGIEASGISGVVNASTYAGNIDVQFNKITPNKAMSFSNFTGPINITMPSTYKADFKMKTNWGDVYSDLDIVTKDIKPVLKKSDEGDTFKLYTDSWT